MMPRVMKQKYPPDRLLKLTETKWRQPKLWEIFTFSVDEWKYMYGRVIHTEPKYWLWDTRPDEYLLIYIYNNISNVKEALPQLKKDNLLIVTTAWREIWQWGYFETIKQKALEKNDFFKPICFYYSFLLRDNYRDEEWNILDKEYKPIIETGTINIHWIQSDILKALWEEVK